MEGIARERRTTDKLKKYFVPVVQGAIRAADTARADSTTERPTREKTMTTISDERGLKRRDDRPIQARPRPPWWLYTCHFHSLFMRHLPCSDAGVNWSAPRTTRMTVEMVDRPLQFLHAPVLKGATWGGATGCGGAERRRPVPRMGAWKSFGRDARLSGSELSKTRVVLDSSLPFAVPIKVIQGLDSGVLTHGGWGVKWIEMACRLKVSVEGPLSGP